MRRTTRVNTCKSDNFLNFLIFNTRFEFFDKLDLEALEYPKKIKNIKEHEDIFAGRF